MKQLGIGIIGTGFGSFLGSTFKALEPDCKIYLCGQNAEKTARIAKDIDAEGVFDDWQELVASPEVGLVVIASPSGLHKEMFEAATKHKKHILLEKPAATTAADICGLDDAKQNLAILEKFAAR